MSRVSGHLIDWHSIFVVCSITRDLTSTYVVNFRLIASDIPWDEQDLMEQFRSGLHSDVKDLLLTFPEDPKSLTEAISRAIWCDNRLFER